MVAATKRGCADGGSVENGPRKVCAMDLRSRDRADAIKRMAGMMRLSWQAQREEEERSATRATVAMKEPNGRHQDKRPTGTAHTQMVRKMLEDETRNPEYVPACRMVPHDILLREFMYHTGALANRFELWTIDLSKDGRVFSGVKLMRRMGQWVREHTQKTFPLLVPADIAFGLSEEPSPQCVNVETWFAHVDMHGMLVKAMNCFDREHLKEHDHKVISGALFTVLVLDWMETLSFDDVTVTSEDEAQQLYDDFESGRWERAASDLGVPRAPTEANEQ